MSNVSRIQRKRRKKSKVMVVSASLTNRDPARPSSSLTPYLLPRRYNNTTKRIRQDAWRGVLPFRISTSCDFATLPNTMAFQQSG